MKLSFIYFNFPFWRSEISKIALYLGDIDFENRIISQEEFQRVKKNGQLDDGTIIPFHQFPCLLVDGVSIAQTGGIARFCGKLSGVYPKNDSVLAARIDQFIDFSTDITVLVSNTGSGDNDEEKKFKREKLAEGELARKLNILERNIQDEGDWTLGSSMGLEDIAIWRLMGWLSSGVVDGIPSNILHVFPKITRVCLAVDKQPKIKEWITRTYPKNYIRGNYS